MLLDLAIADWRDTKPPNRADRSTSWWEKVEAGVQYDAPQHCHYRSPVKGWRRDLRPWDSFVVIFSPIARRRSKRTTASKRQAPMSAVRTSSTPGTRTRL